MLGRWRTGVAPVLSSIADQTQSEVKPSSRKGAAANARADGKARCRFCEHAFGDVSTKWTIGDA